ncbi:pilin [Stenotrophomonas sp. PS02289]|uniref:pilin n=1 Tax=Stenotrophomonas sp. PS02289 TaxID=2991422 RepID=UPI00249A3C01|nr:pilin [Stenotrophomonas sp. PS02289]
MGQWFYAEGNRQQRGPLASEELIALYTSSRIGLDTLVWRDGLAQWLPLRDVAAEIGLVIAPVAPAVPAAPAAPTAHFELESTPEPVAPQPVEPVPPRIPATFQIDTSTRTAPPPPQQPAYSRPAAAPPPKKSGCGPVAIVLAVVGVVLVAIIAILAAIAIPAYNDYVTKAQMAQTVGMLTPLKPRVTEFVANYDRCPVNGDEGFGSPASYATNGVGQVRIGRFGDGRCGVEIEFSMPGKRQIDGKMLWFEYDVAQQQWSCSSDADKRYLPLNCSN